jgi:hypothetical protein
LECAGAVSTGIGVLPQRMKRFDRRNHYVKERGGVPMPDKNKKQQAQAASESTAPEINNQESARAPEGSREPAS